MRDPLFTELRNTLIRGDYEQAGILVSADSACLTARSGIGETVFHWFVVENKIEIATWLYENGSQVDSRNTFDETPLMDAAGLGYFELTRSLLAWGADPKLRSQRGESAIQKAASSNQTDVTKLLLDSMPSDEALNKHFSAVKLHLLGNENSECVQMLMRRGLRFN